QKNINPTNEMETAAIKSALLRIAIGKLISDTTGNTNLRGHWNKNKNNNEMNIYLATSSKEDFEESLKAQFKIEKERMEKEPWLMIFAHSIESDYLNKQKSIANHVGSWFKHLFDDKEVKADMEKLD